MHWPVTWKKLKLNGSMQTYKTIRTNTQKRCPFHYRGLECKSKKSRNSKSKKSRNTWSSRQIWFWSTEWSKAKANRALPKECTIHSKHPLPTTQEKTAHGHHQMVNTEIIDYILCSQRWRSSVQSAKTRRGADCGLDHELLIVKVRLKKMGETTRTFRYDLNHTLYD